ncbi:MAG: hypothetical protein R3E39_08435 [Anaerolineae bacterium]
MYTREQKLQAVIDDIQKKWGDKAIRKARAVSPVNDNLPTGFPSLDALIGGGVERGCLTEIIGLPTSGMTTLALKVMASAQQEGDGVVLFDLAAAFDPAAATFCGVDIANILLLRDDVDSLISMLSDVVGSAIPGLVVVNTFPRLSGKEQFQLSEAIKRLMPLLIVTRCALLLLSLPASGRSFVSQYASLRLNPRFDRWFFANGDVSGFQSVITILKYKGENEGRRVAVPILFDDKSGGVDT